MKPFYQTLTRPVAFLLTLFFIALQFNGNAYQLMSTNFYIVDPSGKPVLKDGNISIYDTPYINGVDWNDGTKLNNGGENWGLIRSKISLVVERRQLVTGADTAFFNMWGMQRRNYRFEVSMKYFDPLTVAAYVWDNYLKTITPIDFSGITTVNFSVDANVVSAAAGRFELIYTTPAKYAALYAELYGPLALKFTGVNASRKDKENGLITWSVENENSLENYSVEHSSDGLHFETIANVIAENSNGINSYQFTYKNFSAADHYYRVKANGTGGRSVMSPVAKVVYHTGAPIVSVYPNPVVNKIMQLQWDIAKDETWGISLVYPDGSTRLLKTVNVPSGHSTNGVNLPVGLHAGIYQLRFTKAGEKMPSKTIIVL